MAVFVGSVFGVLGHVVDACRLDPLVAGVTVGGYVLGSVLRWRLLPPIGLAALAGALSGALGSRISDVAVEWSLSAPRLVSLEITPAAIIGVTLPVIAFSLVTAPRGLAVLIDQRYPVRADRVVLAIGTGTIVNSLFGGGPGGLSNEGGAVLAGPEAGAGERRYLAAGLAGLMMLGIALLAVPLASLLPALPAEYMTTLIGLALLRVVADGFRRMFGGPLRLSPLLTFVVAASSFTLAGFGSVMWSLLVGLLAAVLLEPSDLRAALRQTNVDAA